MENLKIFEFENNLKQIIVNSELTPGTAYHILNKITNEIYDVYMQSVQQEIKQQEQIAKQFNEDIGEKVQDAIASTPIEIGQE